MTSSVRDALRLGCCGVGFTIYPGSEYCFKQMDELQAIAQEARAAGLAVVVWSYPRGPMLDKAGETAVDVCAYAAHMAALMGAHVIKVKPPMQHIGLEAAKKTYEQQNIDISTLAKRVAHVVQCCFDGRRIVIFSGGDNVADTNQFIENIRGLQQGGAYGSIIGRNTFQRPREQALAMLGQVVSIFGGGA